MLHLPPIVATIIFAMGILALFYLDRYPEGRTSKALWIPGVWLAITCSRPVSWWFGVTPTLDPMEAYDEGSPIDRAVFMALILIALAVVIVRMNRAMDLLRRNPTLVLFFLFCAVSILWSDFPYVIVKRWIKAIGELMMVLIILTEPDPVAAVKRLVTRLGFLLFPLSVLFIKYYPSLGRALVYGAWTNEYTGITTQKNTLGLICMIYGVGLLWMFRAVYRDRADPSRRRLRAYSAILLMIVWLLWMCNSLTSIMGLAMTGGVMLWVSRQSFDQKRATVHWLVLAVLGLSLIAMFFNPADLLQAIGRTGTLSGRTIIWHRVLAIQINPWIGTGFESFWLGDRLTQLMSSGFSFPINEAHNGWIEVYINLGWAGVTLITLVLLSGYRKIIAALREDPQTSSLLLGFFLAVLFESLTEAAFRTMSPSWFFVLLAIIAASQAVPRQPPLRMEGGLAERKEPVWAAGAVGAGAHQ